MTITGSARTMAGFGEQPDTDDDDEPDEGTPPPSPVPPPEPPIVDDDVIDGLPPTDDESGDDDDENDDEEQPPVPQGSDDLVAQIEARMQRRFDKAVSKMERNLRRQLAQPPAPSNEGEGGDGGGGTPPPAPAPPAPARQPGVDLTSIRVLAREEVHDQMEGTGSAERKAVRDIVDQLLPRVDWSGVEDPDEFVSQLVQNVKDSTVDMVRVGSDRKVKQLRQAGLLPERTDGGQPGGGPAGGMGGGNAATAMAAGAARAQARWPKGRRPRVGR